MIGVSLGMSSKSIPERISALFAIVALLPADDPDIWNKPGIWEKRGWKIKKKWQFFL